MSVPNLSFLACLEVVRLVRLSRLVRLASLNPYSVSLNPYSASLNPYSDSLNPYSARGGRYLVSFPKNINWFRIIGGFQISRLLG